MREVPTFRPYERADRSSCLELFDENCPTYFAPNERPDYERFLDRAESGYSICLLDDTVVGAFGLMKEEADRWELRWILLASSAQGRGIGRAIMEHVARQVTIARGGVIEIAASHKSAPFFARFGAREVGRIAHGWGPEMHRVDMQLLIAARDRLG